MAAKFTFALQGINRNLVHISDVKIRGNDGLFCQDCSAEFIAVVNVRKISAHFRHKNEDLTCKASFESALHQAAKAILLKSRSVFIPDYGNVFYEDPVAEKGCDRFRPDITIQTVTGEVYIEIVVSNHPSEEKEMYYGRRNALCLIVDLSDIDRSVDLPALEEIVLADSGYKRVVPATREVVIPVVNDSSDSWIKWAAVAGFGFLVYKWIKSRIRIKKRCKLHR